MENKQNFFKKLVDILNININLSKNKTSELNNNKTGKYSRGYRASKQSNSNYLWGRVGTTEDHDAFQGLESLKARSRSLSQNNPIMKHYLMMLDNNIVGKDGFKNQILGKDNEGKLDIIENKIISNAWEDFGKAKNCDITNKNNLKQITSIIIKNLAKDGEVLIRLIRSKASNDNKYGFKLQLLDSERLAIELNKDIDKGFIRMGVELDLFGSPVAYWLRKFSVKDNNHISGTTKISDYERISKDDLIHLFMQENSEQTRGIPWAHSVMIYMEDLDDFNQACLLAAKVGAASSIYLEREQGVKTQDVADYEENGEYISEMGFGQIVSLPVGARMKSFEGKYPSDAYQVYTKRLLQQIAGGLGLSQVFLGNDTEDLNYSTARTVILEERNYYQTLQQFIIDFFLDLIYIEWLTQSLLNGSIKYQDKNGVFKTMGAEKLSKFSEHNFIGRKWEGIDPLKEENAKQSAYENMRKPLSVILAEQGLDLQEVINQYKQDNDIIKNILGENFKIKV